LIFASRLFSFVVVPEVAIIVPVYNEEDNVLPMAREVSEAMKKAGRSYELVFVDDASTDFTWSRIDEARRQFPSVRGLRHAVNSGQSAALWTGIQASSSEIIATLDGDLQNDPADIPHMLPALDKADFVCGVRAKRRDTFVRRGSSKIARWARRSALKVDFCDTGCAMRVFRRSALTGVFPFNGFHRFLPVLVHGNGVSTLEVPVNHRPRVAGVSKYGVWNRVWRGIYDLIALSWFQKRRLRPVQFTELKGGQ
jgi:dolichol-phosphate mannosyltransferase